MKKWGELTGEEKQKVLKFAYAVWRTPQFRYMAITAPVLEACHFYGVRYSAWVDKAFEKYVEEVGK